MARIEQVHAMKASGQTNRQIAATLGLSHNTVRRLVGEYSRRQRVNGDHFAASVNMVTPLSDRLGVELYTYKGVSQRGLPRYTGAWALDFDSVMIAGDLHAPTTAFSLVDSMCAVARRHILGKRHLLLVGDIWNGEKDSVHEAQGGEQSREVELQFVTEILSYLLDTFDKIWITPGNHLRKRLLRILGADMSPERIVRTITTGTNDSRVQMSWYDVVHVRSAGREWTLTHQYEYSINKLIVADKLAQKYHTNVITFHQHHTAIGIDRYGRYITVDCGGLHDGSLMAYQQLVPSSKARPSTGFVLMQDGVANLFSPHPGLTNWRLWGVEPPPFVSVDETREYEKVA